MSDSIRLHKDHGVNPTISLCFWCGKEKNEIALLGAAYKGQAPMHMVTNLDPCEACVKVFAQGMLLIETIGEPFMNEYSPALLKERPCLPTGNGHSIEISGRHWVIKREAADRVGLPNVPKALVDKETAEELGLYEGSEE